MLQSLDVLRLAKGLGEHAMFHQKVVAENVAQSDTPNYRARDVSSFRDMMSPDPSTPLRNTRPGHQGGHDAIPRMDAFVDLSAEAAPNGNSVSIEAEMVKSTEARRQFDLSLAVYRSSLDILRSALRAR